MTATTSMASSTRPIQMRRSARWWRSCGGCGHTLWSPSTPAAADTRYADRSGRRPHRVSKLYYLAPGADQIDLYQAAFGELAMTIDGVGRRATAWPDWAITTRVDTSAYWRQVWQAIACHQSQLPGYQTLLHMPDGDHHRLWGMQTFYRVFSLVNGGREVEEDLFVGLR
jgi:hypothetical protein